MNDDNSVVCISPAKMEELGFFRGDNVLVKGSYCGDQPDGLDVPPFLRQEAQGHRMYRHERCRFGRPENSHEQGLYMRSLFCAFLSLSVGRRLFVRT